jgi:hypothetical protein
MAGIAPLHAPSTARLYIQRNLPSQGKRIEIAMSVAFLFLDKGRKFRACCTPFRIIRPSRGRSMK